MTGCCLPFSTCTACTEEAAWPSAPTLVRCLNNESKSAGGTGARERRAQDPAIFHDQGSENVQHDENIKKLDTDALIFFFESLGKGQTMETT